jgi:ATP-dependent RNA helicase MSS116
LQNTAGLVDRMAKLSVLVLDEADQLLDMGFRPDIERILNLLKPSCKTRQTLLFSATVPSSVKEIASVALRPKYNFVDTVGKDEEQTHTHVRQELMVAPQAEQIQAIYSILRRETTQDENYKIIVFFTTARLTGFMAELFNSVQDKTGFQTMEIHSRKSQAVRRRASDYFRDSKKAVLFSSDVSARGMDYPDVSFVLQVGLTDRAQYIHRLGRTARAGKEGRGTLLLAPFEEKHMTVKELVGMPLVPTQVPVASAADKADVAEAIDGVAGNDSLRESAEQAYRAWLGYYNGHLKKCAWDKKQLVKEANQWAMIVGLKQQPKLLKKTVGKMQLKGIPGLLVE